MNYDQWLSSPYDNQKFETEPDKFSLCNKCDESIGFAEYQVEYDDEEGHPIFCHQNCLLPNQQVLTKAA